MEKRMDATWTDTQIRHMAEAGLDHRGELGTMLRYLGIQQILNRISNMQAVSMTLVAIHRQRSLKGLLSPTWTI